MPALIGNYRKSQTVTQLKKAYSELNQSVKISENEYGTMDTWDFSSFDNALVRADYFFQNYLSPNIKILEICSPSSSTCWEDTYTLDGTKSYINNDDNDGKMSFVTTSGYSVYFWVHGTGDGGWFWIDINGAKKPNVMGKDVFPFIMTWGNGKGDDHCDTKKLGLFPAGLDCQTSLLSRDDLINGTSVTQAKGFNCKKGAGASRAGGFCAALIMFDGWQISKDYPW